MPFVRFSRDRNGYEHTYLMHAGSKKGAPARMLYWYRTPPGVKVGRVAFDPEVRRTLEAQYPSVTFDWDRIVATPMPPPPEVEHWRERRRAERAAKTARASRDAESVETSGPGAQEADSAEPAYDGRPEPTAEPASAGAGTQAESLADGVPPARADSSGVQSDAQAGNGKRRRRGGRRRRRGGAGQSSGAPSDTSGSSG